MKTIKDALEQIKNKIDGITGETLDYHDEDEINDWCEEALAEIEKLEAVDVGELREAIDDMETGIQQSEKCEPPYTLIAVERDQMKTWKKMFKTLAELMGGDE